MESFTDKQWWFQELEAIAKTPDQIRAIAVLRNLLHSYKEVSNSKATVVPEGWILVPKEAGVEMLRAGEQAYPVKENDMNSPTPTEFPWELGGPMGYAWNAMIKNIPPIPFAEPTSIESRSSVETILASLEHLCKKFPTKYAFGEEPVLDLKINGEDWVIQRCNNDVDRYYLTRGTPNSIAEARDTIRRSWAVDRASCYNNLLVHVRANGNLSNVNISDGSPVVMSLADMAKAIRKMLWKE